MKKYVVAAAAAVVVFAAVPQAEAKRAQPYAKLTAFQQFERSVQCWARSNDAKIAVSKRADFRAKCRDGRA